LVNNPEIRGATRRVAIAATTVRSAGSLSDPEFMYRGWGTPLAKPWDLNQTQHKFMFNQSLPGPGKRPLRRQLASEEVEQGQGGTGDQAARCRLKSERRSTTFSAIRTNSCCMTSKQRWLDSLRSQRASSMLSRHSCAWRHGQLFIACADCDSGDLHLAARKSPVTKGKPHSRHKEESSLNV
jgi:hypothetical protein